MGIPGAVRENVDRDQTVSSHPKKRGLDVMGRRRADTTTVPHCCYPARHLCQQHPLTAAMEEEEEEEEERYALAGLAGRAIKDHEKQ